MSNKELGYVVPTETDPAPTGQGKGAALKIADYLSDLKIFGVNGSDQEIEIFDQSGVISGEFTPPTGVEYVSSGGTDGKVYTVRVNKSLLKTRGASTDGVYVLPIRYKVKTGDGTDKWNSTYSNYKVTLTAEMYTPATASAELTRLSSSWASDHLIYTNAKVQTKVI